MNFSSSNHEKLDKTLVHLLQITSCNCYKILIGPQNWRNKRTFAKTNSKSFKILCSLSSTLWGVNDKFIADKIRVEVILGIGKWIFFVFYLFWKRNFYRTFSILFADLGDKGKCDNRIWRNLRDSFGVRIMKQGSIRPSKTSKYPNL